LQLHKFMEKNLINDAPKKPSYDFVDHIRCLAMMAIVAEHSLGAGVAVLPQSARFNDYLHLMQVTKFGTITFFLLAGFLIGEKFTDYTPGQYLKRRFSNTFGPWLFWSGVFIVCFIANLAVKERMYHDGRFSLANILDGIKTVYFFTNYWFIINFMISISLLLVFKKHLYTLTFGAVLLAFTLFYSVNIHYEWINPTHTIAIFGFIFFLWLGAQLRKHWLTIDTYLHKVPYWALIIPVIIAYVLGITEIKALAGHSSEPFNTLRFSNILYSLTVFAFLLKVRNIKMLNYLKPRDTTFGIYLIHYIILAFAIPEILRPLHIEVEELNLSQYFGYKLLFFILVYTVTIILVRLINKTKARRLVGN